MPRKFVYDGKELPEVNPNMKPDEVRQHYTNFLPELANAETVTSTVDGVDIYEFKKRTGTKG